MENDIKNTFHWYSNISKVDKYTKFVEFKSRINSSDDVILKNRHDLYLFSSDDLECEKLKKEDKEKSLKKMIECIRIYINNEIEKELEIERNKLYKKYHDMYKIS